MALVEIASTGHHLLERIQVDDEEIDRRDRVLLHGRAVLGVAAPGEEAAVDGRVQRFHAPVHHLRIAGQLGDIAHGDPGFREHARRSAGRNEFDAARDEGSGERDEARLVGNGQERPRDASNLGQDFLRRIRRRVRAPISRR